jgi:signal transduction histidine kinase
VIRECLDGLKVEMQVRGIEVVHREGQPRRVRGCRAQLSRALGNVLTNAVQAMPRGGRLMVETSEPEAGNLEVVVEDTGPGMPPSLARRVFKPFFTTKPNGTGLGLALSRRIVERHAGRIRLDSRLGHGTRVILSLPRGA